MSDNGPDEPSRRVFNIIKQRGTPDTAVTLSGHTVNKKETVVIPSPFDGSMISLACADYHDEHFVYIDPNFEKTLDEDDDRSLWFAMCTCGSPAVIIGGEDVLKHNGDEMDLVDRLMGKGIADNMLVCQFYYQSILAEGFGYHANQDKREWT